MQPPAAPANAATSGQQLPLDAGHKAERREGERVGADRADAQGDGAEADPARRRDPAADGAEPGQAGDEGSEPDADRAEAVVADGESRGIGGDADHLARPDADRHRRGGARQPEDAGAGAQDADAPGEIERDVGGQRADRQAEEEHQASSAPPTPLPC